MDLVRTKDGDSDLALLDRMFDSFFDWQLPAPRISYAVAPLDIYEKDGKYVLEMAAPGFDPKEVNVEVSGATVTITGNRTERTEKKRRPLLPARDASRFILANRNAASRS
ncbi:MAG: Hsp20/alpha crystallin family protein [Candidatus Cybelea sp.]